MAPRKPIKKTQASNHRPEAPGNTPRPERPARQWNVSAWVDKARSLARDERTRYAAGLFLLLAMLYVSLSFVSYFFTGAADQSKLDVPWSELKGMRDEIQNWTSVTGACMAEWCINRWFGLPVFAGVWFFTAVGLRLVNVRRTPIVRTFFHCFFWLVWDRRAGHPHAAAGRAAALLPGVVPGHHSFYKRPFQTESENTQAAGCRGRGHGNRARGMGGRRG